MQPAWSRLPPTKKRRPSSALDAAHASNKIVVNRRKTKAMKRILLATALTLFASTATFAADPAIRSEMSPSSPDALTTTMPGDAVTVTNWYKQNVYDASNNKIGEIVDVLMNKNGQATTVILSVGGFLGMDLNMSPRLFTQSTPQ